MEVKEFPYHCGTKIICDFWSYGKVPYCNRTVYTFIGIFIDAPEQRKSYMKMCKQYKVLYQSPVLKREGGLGNDYFIVIWLNEKP